MHPDFNELFAVLNAEQVKYLVVGGYAVSLHAQPRATKDLDILVKPDKANVAALFRALAKFGAPLEGLKPDDFAERGSFYRMGSPPVMVDIMPEISGVDFGHAWTRRVMATIDDKTGLQAPFISAADLMAAKNRRGVRKTSPTWRRYAKRRTAPQQSPSRSVSVSRESPSRRRRRERPSACSARPGTT